jgi:hypothetical protein
MKSLAAAIVIALLVGCKPKVAECPPPVQCPPEGPAVALPAASAGDAGGAASNVVQTEMRMLSQIIEATVRGIGANDVKGIDEQLHQLHAAKEATAEAVKSGAYRLPKNPDGVAQFTKMDESFHEHLGALVTASRVNDVAAAAEALSQIVRGCPGCHAAFRP